MRKLKINVAAFNAELVKMIGPDKVGWSLDENWTYVTRLFPLLVDENGKRVVLQQKHYDLLRLIYRSTEEAQRNALKLVFGEVDCELEEQTAQIMALPMSAAQFGAFLAEQINPQTGRPYIRLEKKRGVKKKALAALFAPTPTEVKAGEEEQQEPEPGELDQAEEEPEIEEAEPAEQPVAKTAKPTMKKG